MVTGPVQGSYSVLPILLFLQSGIAAFLLVALYGKRGERGLRRVLSLFLVGVAIWTFGYGVQLSEPGLQAQLFWQDFQYVGTVLVPASWFVFTVLYSGRWERVGRRGYLLAVEPVLTLLLAGTEGSHGLVREGVEVVSVGQYFQLSAVHGPWFWVHVVYSYLLILGGAWILLDFVRERRGLFRKQAYLLLAAVFFPLAGTSLWVAGVTEFDPGPFAFFLTSVALYGAVTRYGLLDLVPEVREQVLDFMDDGVLVLDSFGRVIDLNSTATSILSPEEVVGLGLEEVAPELASVLEGEERSLEVDGRIYDVQVSDLGDGVEGCIVVLRDVTRREELLNSVRESQELYRALFESSNDGILVVQDEELKLVNRRFGEIVGADPEEVEGDDFLEYVAPEYRERVGERYRKRLSGGDPPGRYEIEAFTAEGETVPVEINLSLIEFEGRKANMAVVRDVSRRKAWEQEVMRSRKQLDVLDRFLRHNIRNSMNLVLGYAGDVKNGFPGAREEAERIEEIAEELLDTSAKEREIVQVVASETEVAPRDLSEEVATAVSQIEKRYPDAEIENGLPEGLEVLAVPDMHKPIKELIENGIEHEERGEPWVGIRAEEGDGRVILEVQDSAPRIPEEERDVLTGDLDIGPLSHGSGLGLWLVNWAMDRSGGEVGLERNEMEGNSVILEFRSP